MDARTMNDAEFAATQVVLRAAIAEARYHADIPTEE